MIFLLSDYIVTQRVQNEIFSINELVMRMDPITIFDDNFAEPNETIQLTLSIAEGRGTLNVSPPREPLTITIIDDDGITTLMVESTAVLL